MQKKSTLRGAEAGDTVQAQKIPVFRLHLVRLVRVACRPDEPFGRVEAVCAQELAAELGGKLNGGFRGPPPPGPGRPGVTLPLVVAVAVGGGGGVGTGGRGGARLPRRVHGTHSPESVPQCAEERRHRELRAKLEVLQEAPPVHTLEDALQPTGLPHEGWGRPAGGESRRARRERNAKPSNGSEHKVLGPEEPETAETPGKQQGRAEQRQSKEE